MRKRLLLGIVTVSVALASAGTATVAVAESGGPDEELLNQKLSALADVADTTVIAEVRRDGEVWAQASGTRADDGDEEAKPTDRVKVGSLTKSMVATVVLQLTQEGKLKLDDSIQELAPGVLPYEETITVRQLLSHTSGVPDYFVDIYPSLAQGSPADIEENRLNEYTPQQLIDTATKRPLNFTPGSDYSYSNTGYYVLGLLIEQITGNSIEAEVTQRVVKPSGMDVTYLPETDPSLNGDHLRAYVDTGKTPGQTRVDTSKLSPTQFWAAGVAASNPGDVNRLYRAMFDGTLLSKDLLDEARDFTEQSGGAYGLGLQATPVQCEGFPDDKAVGHTGGTLGHTTFSFHSADANVQVSYTYAADTQFLPKEELQKVFTAANELLLAGLCGDTGAKTAQVTDIDSISDPLMMSRQ